MRKLLYGLICMFLIGFLAACGGGNDESGKDTTTTDEQAGEETADATDGDALFQQSCSSCHGADLKSGGAPDLDKVGSKYSKDEIEQIILNGKGGMPAGLLKGEDADAVASWLADKK